MKKILVISDDHGNISKTKEILQKENYVLSIHLGDSQVSESKIKSLFDKYVPGNNDFLYKSKLEKIFEFNNLKIGIMHGHSIGIFVFSNNNSYFYAKKHNLDILFYGHTHIPFVEEYEKNKYIICPGSLTLSRKGSNSYAILEIDDNKVLDVKIKNCN